MRKILTLVLFLSCASWAQAAEKYQVQAGLYKNVGNYTMSNLQSGLSTASYIFGYQASFLEEQGEFMWPEAVWSYGASYYRMQGGGGTFVMTDGYEAVVEMFYGDKTKVVQKRPFWEKLWYRAGLRGGIYYWVTTQKSGNKLTEAGSGSYFNSSGLTISAYAAVGLGRLGSLEYTQRTHLSNGSNDSELDHGYIAYVQYWDF